jgi:hypothetical protein
MPKNLQMSLYLFASAYSALPKARKCPSADATSYRQCPEIVSSTNGINITYGGVMPDETRINEQ